ncbi:MAG: hypothetical protein ACR2K9_04450, partial [Solirubrobacteraceae bacterium]
MSVSRPTPPRGRVRWGNVGRAALVLVALAALIAWPRGRPPGPPSYAPVPVAPAPSRELPPAQRAHPRASIRPSKTVRPGRHSARHRRRQPARQPG